MVDGYSVQLAFLIFESIFCFLSALVYSASKDSLQIRKSVVLSLSITCGAMLLFEYLFYVYNGSQRPLDTFIMYIVNAGVYYLIVMLLFFYTMFVSLRLFQRFDFKKDMPCRIRIISVLVIVIIGLTLVTISQFTGIYYYFDSNNVYQRGPLFWLSAVIPTIGAIIVASMIIQHRDKISKSQMLVLLSYLVLPMIGEAIQMFWFGTSLLNICLGLSVLLMFFENVIHKEKEIIRASKTEVRTGLANEHGYIEWINSMKGNPELKKYAAVFFDLRRFSDINRIYGIENGNRVLANFGNIMSSYIESDEIIGRQFGNQFVAIIKKRNLDHLLEVLKKIDVPFIDSDSGKDTMVSLSARVGVYMIDRTDLNGEDILVFAGQALGVAKSKDSDEVVMLTQELIDAIADRKKLESDIKKGLMTSEFNPYYQPKVNINTGKLCGIEALSRWHHDGITTGPGLYIALMESNDTIRLLDFSMLQSVCEDISKWLEAGLDVPTVSINFSRRNLVDDGLAKRIDTVVRSTGIPKDLIEIEVTESSDEFSINVLKSFVDDLHDLGYKVSIDDFGSASSSLALLREVAFDTLKIDKGFVDHAKAKDITILTHIVRLAKEINVELVAEGVEQKNQIDILGTLGVEVIQGYYYDKPLSKDEMTERLRSPEYKE